MDGLPTDGCPHTPTTTGIGTGGIPITMVDMVMDTIRMGIHMAITVDIRTWYTPAISAILIRLEEQARHGMLDTVAQVAAIVLGDTLARLEGQAVR